MFICAKMLHSYDEVFDRRIISRICCAATLGPIIFVGCMLSCSCDSWYSHYCAQRQPQYLSPLKRYVRSQRPDAGT